MCWSVNNRDMFSSVVLHPVLFTDEGPYVYPFSTDTTLSKHLMKLLIQFTALDRRDVKWVFSDFTTSESELSLSLSSLHPECQTLDWTCVS